MTRPTTSLVRRNGVMLCLAPPIIYFGFVFPLMVLAGFEPATHYYNMSSVARIDVLLDLVFNLVFCGIFIYALLKTLPEQIAIPQIGSWLGIIAATLTILIFSGSNWDLTREQVKSSATVWRAIGISGASAYLGATVLTTGELRKLLLAAGVLVASIALSWERDQILYLLFPLLVRLVQLQLRPVLTALAGASGAVLLLGYKFIVTAAKSVGGFRMDLLVSNEFWDFVLRSFAHDNLHKSMLEISYISGDHPRYNILSYFRPLQVERLFDASAMTNGQIATLYYTAGATGTGFSAPLEAWLNFGLLGLLVFPYLMARAVGLACTQRSAIWLIALLVFMTKLQRSDLWPAVISLLLGPLIITCVWLLVRSAKGGPASLHGSPPVARGGVSKRAVTHAHDLRSPR